MLYWMNFLRCTYENEQDKCYLNILTVVYKVFCNLYPIHLFLYE